MGSKVNRKNLSLDLSSPMDHHDGVTIPLQSDTPSSPTVQYSKQIFDMVDTDHNGYITTTELKAMIRKNQGESKIPPHLVRRIQRIDPIDPIDQIHRQFDTNHDGKLDYEEFVKMINDPKLKRMFECYITKNVNFFIPRNKLPQVELDRLDFEKLYEDEYSCYPPTLGMIIISIIELIFFLIDEFHEKGVTTSGTGPMATLFIYDPTKRYQVWRYLTYMFVHIGYLHLSVNLLVQMFIGILLEMVHGWWRVLLVYSTGVIAGSLGSSIADPTASLAGASGGVYALITAHIASIILNWKEMSFPGVQLVIFLLITGVDVGSSVYNRYWADMDENIGFVSHFGGAVAGLLVGILVLKNLKITKKENIVWYISVAIYVVLMLVGICWNIFYPDYFPKQI